MAWFFVRCVQRSINFGSVFPNNLDRRIYVTKFAKHVSSPFSIFCCSFHFNFSFDVQSLPFIRDLATLLPYQSPVNFRMKRCGGNLGTKLITVAIVIVHAWNLYCYLKAFSRNCLLLGKLHGKTMAGNVVISEVDALPYIVVSRAETHVPHVELVRNTERITL
jgi:hypothetical protein